MKQGDRVICKKSIDGYDTHFVSGKEYFIYETANNAVYIRFDYNQGRWFTIEMFLDWDNSAFKYDFKSHFYTEQEFRKMKLEKLNSL